MSEAILATSASYGDSGTKPLRRDRFFLGMSAALLSILLIGFSPTLYLRAVFDVPPIPLYLHVHGATVTAWFLLLVSQAFLINSKRVHVHRRLGAAGVLVGAAVVPAGLIATLNVARRLPEMGFELEPVIYFISWVVWGNFYTLTGFVIFVATALLLRKRAEAHKRLMLFATMCLMAPPLARVSGMFGWVLEAEIVFVTITWLALLVPMVLHDVIVDKRLHKATWIGGLLFIMIVLEPVIVARAQFAQDFVRGLA